MLRALGIRGAQMLLTVLGIFAIMFFLVRVSGDPVALILGPSATTDQIEALRQSMGLDRPLLVQFAQELGRALTLDFGVSIRGGQDALSLALDRLWVSLELVLGAFVFAVSIAIPLGVVAAVWRHSWLSDVLMSVTFLGQALPIFLTGPLLIILFSVEWQVLPTSGWDDPADRVLPVVTLGLVLMAKLARVTRAQMIEMLDQDFVRTARSKGLSPARVVLVHGLRNALVPIVTVIGTDLGQLVGSAVLTETIFAIPGIGQLLLQSALARDYPMLQAGVFLVAVIVIGLNLAADLLYRVLDPRVGRGQG